MNEKLYAAYGSNLNLNKMALRCKTAKITGIGKIENYQLLFRGEKQRVYATIEPKVGSNVPALIWEIKSEDENALDVYEDYPNLYRKESINVNVNGSSVKTMAYIMNDGYPLAKPLLSYVEEIKDGYLAVGFKADMLDIAM